MSWDLGDGQYDLFFNRDERRTRLPAAAPGATASAGTRVLAPRDGDAGGSWVAVNEDGVTIALLNGYLAEDGQEREHGWSSRGHLVLELSGSATLAAVAERLRAAELAAYRSFRLFALALGGQRCWHWSRGRLHDVPAVAPAISSSFRIAEVRSSREALFRRQVTGSGVSRRDQLLDFHRAHAPDRGPFSPCMHRDDAHTVSFTWVHVDAREVSMRYGDDAPCRAWPPGAPLVLPRR